jgi:hypothetical protein
MTDDMSGNMDEAVSAALGENAEPLPKWEQGRIDKITRQKHEQRERADTAERQNAVLEGRLQALEGQMSNSPGPAQQAPEPKGLDKFKTVAELKAVSKRLYEYQALAGDPDATPEARQAARAELSSIDDVPGTMSDIQARMAEIIADDRDTKYRAERSEIDNQTAGTNALMSDLISKYSIDAVRQGSDLQKLAAKKIQSYINSGDVTEANSGQQFIIKMAFKEAHEEIANGRGGRGSDPRHSAIEQGNGGRTPVDPSLMAALKERGDGGDHAAGRKARDMEVGQFLSGLMDQGHIASG